MKATGVSTEAMMAAIFGTIMAASMAEVLISRVLQHAQRVITPLVAGIVVTLIGLTLIQIGLTSMGGGYAAIESGTFGSMQNLALSGTVLGLIVVLNRAKMLTFVWHRSLLQWLQARYLPLLWGW